MRKVVHVITGLSTGGAEMMLHKLVSSEQQFKHVVISLNGRGDTIVAQKLLASNITLHCLDMKKRTNKLASLRQLVRLVKNESPNVIQTWMYHANLITTLLCLIFLRDVPVIWNVRHSISDINHESRSIRWVIRLSTVFSKHPRNIVFNSLTSQMQHEALGFEKSKSIMLPNGFELSKLRLCKDTRLKIRDSLGVGQDTLVIGMVARYHPMKGHDCLLQAFEQIAADPELSDRKLALVLIGPGVASDNAAFPSVNNSIIDKTYLLGERDNIAEFYNIFDIYVSSSLWGEGFSNVVGESMAYGLPSVVTDVGDSANIVGESGLVISPANIVELVDAIKSLINSNEKEQAKRRELAQSRLRQNFSIEAIANKYSQLYASVIDS